MKQIVKPLFYMRKLHVVLALTSSLALTLATQLYKSEVNNEIVWRGLPLPYLAYIECQSKCRLDDFFPLLFLFNWLLWFFIALLAIVAFLKVMSQR
jgi:hypothetical protein